MSQPTLTQHARDICTVADYRRVVGQRRQLQGGVLGLKAADRCTFSTDMSANLALLDGTGLALRFDDGTTEELLVNQMQPGIGTGRVLVHGILQAAAAP